MSEKHNRNLYNSSNILIRKCHPNIGGYWEIYNKECDGKLIQHIIKKCFKCRQLDSILNRQNYDLSISIN